MELVRAYSPMAGQSHLAQCNSPPHQLLGRFHTAGAWQSVRAHRLRPFKQPPLRVAFPEELDKLQRLSRLTLQGNQLSSTVPFKLLWNLSHLRWLDLSSNRLTGPISELLSPLESVRTLGIDPNTTLTSRSSGETEEAQRPSRRGFSGDQLLRLKSLDLANKTALLRAALASQNQPRRFGADSFQPPSAEERLLDLSSSNLTRTILSKMSTYAGRLYFLNLSSNNLSGAIPTELGRLAELSELDSSANPLLTGLFPRDFLHNRVCSPWDPSPLHVNLQGTRVRLDRATKESACNLTACPTISFLTDEGLYRRPSVIGYDWGYPNLCVRLKPVRYILNLLNDTPWFFWDLFGVLVVQWFVVIGLAIALIVSIAKRTSRSANNVIA